MPSRVLGCEESLPLSKTRMCRFNVKGLCKRGQTCNFAHAESELLPQPNLFKTELCNSFLAGWCRRGSRCRFAHHLGEIRPAPRPQQQLTAYSSLSAAVNEDLSHSEEWSEPEASPAAVAVCEQVEALQRQAAAAAARAAAEEGQTATPWRQQQQQHQQQQQQQRQQQSLCIMLFANPMIQDEGFAYLPSEASASQLSSSTEDYEAFEAWTSSQSSESFGLHDLPNKQYLLFGSPANTHSSCHSEDLEEEGEEGEEDREGHSDLQQEQQQQGESNDGLSPAFHWIGRANGMKLSVLRTFVVAASSEPSSSGGARSRTQSLPSLR